MRGLLAVITAAVLAPCASLAQSAPGLLWTDLSGLWELVVMREGSDTVPAIARQSPLKVVRFDLAMSYLPTNPEHRPSFTGIAANASGIPELQSAPQHSVHAHFRASDSVLLSISPPQRTMGNSLLFLGRLEGDSLRGVWFTGGHYNPFHRGRAVLRRVEPERPTPTRALPPVRQISVRVAASESTFSVRPSAVVLSHGSVMLADWRGQRVLHFDPTLSEAVTIFDRNTPRPLRFPVVPPVLFVGAGDTVYMTDIPGRGLRVISPSGLVVRRQSLARSEDLPRIVNLSAAPQFAGRYLFFNETLVGRLPGNFSAEPRDSLYLVRVDLATQDRDTLGIVHMKRSSVTIPRDSVPGEQRELVAFMAPFDIGDAMAMNSFGELGIIRAADFHVDWLRPDGTWRRSPPAQWPWKRLPDSVRSRIAVDRNRSYESGRVQAIQPAGRPALRIVMQAGPVPVHEPAFAPMSAIADRNGLIWVQLGARSMGEVPGPPTYAAIDTTGQIVDRIELPEGRTLIGFDRSGHIYAITSPQPVRIEVYRPRF